MVFDNGDILQWVFAVDQHVSLSFLELVTI